MLVPFVPIEQVAKHFTVSLSTIRAWVRQGKIPPNTYIEFESAVLTSVPSTTK